MPNHQHNKSQGTNKIGENIAHKSAQNSYYKNQNRELRFSPKCQLHEINALHITQQECTPKYLNSDSHEFQIQPENFQCLESSKAQNLEWPKNLK